MPGSTCETTRSTPTRFFANLNGQRKPELRYNTFGFNGGGPVPKIGHEKKTFFFYNQEWRREIQGNQINASSYPTAARGGDFSYLLPTSSGGTCTGGSCVLLKAPQTSDPAEITKLAQYGLTPGGVIPNNVIPSGFDRFQCQGAFIRRPLPRSQRGQQSVLRHS